MAATGGSAAANGVSESGGNGGGGGGGNGGNGGSSGNGGPCGACKFLRRKCVNGCIFAPFFDPDQGTMHFAAVHKVFGASNVSKLLVHLPVHRRLEAIVTICYEAEARIRDPVYGCTSHIFALQQQVVDLQSEVSHLRARLATLQTPTPQPFAHLPSHLTFLADIQSASSYHSTCDLDSLLDTSIQSLMQREQHQEGELQQLGAVDEGSIFNDHPFTGEEYQLMLDELVEKNKLGSPKQSPSMSE